MRILIAIAAYIFSSYGISASLGLTLLSISMIAEPLMFDSLQSYLSFVAGFVVLYAWIVHLIMCISWIADKKINKFWPISGTIAGTLSFFYFANMFASGKASNFFSGLLFPVIFTLPVLLLAIYLDWFHMSSMRRT